MIQDYLVTDNFIYQRNTIGNIINSIDKDIREYNALKKEGENVDYEIFLLKMFKDDLKNLIKRYVQLDVVVLREQQLIKI